MFLAAVPLIALGACLLVVSIEDVRRRRIPNGAVLVLLVLALHRAFVPFEAGTAAAHLLLAAGMAGLFIAAYAAGFMGGGDTKLLTVAVLWIGPEEAILFALLLFAAVLAVAALVWVRAFSAGERVRRRTIPFGPPVAIAWFTTSVLAASS